MIEVTILAFITGFAIGMYFTTQISDWIDRRRNR